MYYDSWYFQTKAVQELRPAVKRLYVQFRCVPDQLQNLNLIMRFDDSKILFISFSDTFSALAFSLNF